MVKPLLVGGEWLATQRELIVRSPEDSRELAAVSLAGPDENAAAISAAAAAARELRGLPRYALAEARAQDTEAGHSLLEHLLSLPEEERAKLAAG